MQKLEINGQQYPIKLSYSAILDYCELEGIQLYDYGDRMAHIDFTRMTNEAVRSIATLILCAITRGCEIEKTEFELSVNDIIDAIFSDFSVLEKAMAAINNDMPVKKKEKVNLAEV